MPEVKAAFKLAALALWIGFWCMPVWAAQRLNKTSRRDAMVQLCYRGILRIARIRLKIVGRPDHARPLLLVANHLSYLDIWVLGAAARVKFVAKSEISRWPAIGWICRICDVIFVDRRPEKIKEMTARLQSALARGELVCLFPEGTTGTGMHLLPFKSGFFGLVEEPAGGALAVQPAAIRYTHISKLPIDSTQWPAIAWYGDMELAPHIWALLKMGSVDAEVNFLPSLQGNDRKALAASCRQKIAQIMENPGRF